MLHGAMTSPGRTIPLPAEALGGNSRFLLLTFLCVFILGPLQVAQLTRTHWLVTSLHFKVLGLRFMPSVQQVRPISYCAKHCVPQPELSGVQLVKPGDKPEGKDALPNDADANGLWNGQPFRQPPAVPIPDCPAGCARAQPLLVPPSSPPL